MVDDIDNPSIYDMYKCLKKDEMLTLIDVVHTTALSRRTGPPVLDPLADGWWRQGYNKRNKIIDWSPAALAVALMPRSLHKAILQRVIK